MQGGSDKSLRLGCDLSPSGSAASSLTVKASRLRRQYEVVRSGSVLTCGPCLPTVALFFVAPHIKDALQQYGEGCDGRLVQV